MGSKLLNILSLIVCGVLILSCDKNDNDPANSFSFYYQDYPIKTGIIDLDPDSSPSNYIGKGPIYFHKIYLLTDGLSISRSDSTGTGSMISLTLVSATGEIDAGTYFFAESANFMAGDWTGSMLIDYPTGTVHFLFRGKVIIARNGDVYTIDLDSPEYQGTPEIRAHFQGTLSPLR